MGGSCCHLSFHTRFIVDPIPMCKSRELPCARVENCLSRIEE
jgi:hypothetical protein